MIRLIVAGAAMLTFAGSAEGASDAAARFGTREDVQQISLSPDGKHVAIVAAGPGRSSALVIVSTEDGIPRPVMKSTGNPDQLHWCHWSTNTRLVCSVYMVLTDGEDLIPFSRLITVDSTGQNIKLLTPRDSAFSMARANVGGSVIDWTGDGSGGSVLMTRDYMPEQTIDRLTADSRKGRGVDRVDTTTLKRSNIEPPRTDAAFYISDGLGRVRIMALRRKDNDGFDTGEPIYYYRKADSREWLPMTTGVDTATFTPLAIDSQHNLAYGLADKGGRAALFSVSLDGSLRRDLVLERPDVDVDNLISVGRQGRIVGASYASERRQTEFFDPELRKLAASLSKALPGLPLVSFVDATADESKLLLFAGSDVDPGHYYLFDKATHALTEVMAVRPPLAQTTLATVKPVSFPAADGTMIPGYLTLPAGSDGKNLPTIVMPHGGPADRDEWGFDWLSQFLANRGFAVLQPNYRGSTGYGSVFEQKNGFQSWRTAIGDVNDSGRWLIKQGIADPARLAIFGWSYGGYAALQSAVLDPSVFKAIVAVAPVTDLETLRSESEHFTNHSLVDSYIGHGPHVREGSPAQNVGRITAPVLLFHGDRDRNVSIGESRMMASRLKGAGKPVELVEYHDLDHQLDDSNVRIEMLDKIDGFLRTTLKLPPAP